MCLPTFPSTGNSLPHSPSYSGCHVSDHVTGLPKLHFSFTDHWTSGVRLIQDNQSASWPIPVAWIKKTSWGLPWWCSGWESACQCRGHGFEPWSGKIPHATEQLSPWATTTEPARLEPVLHNKRGRNSERPVHRDKSGPRSPQLEKALARKRRPNTAKNK